MNVGDGKASVLQKCREPVVKDAFCKPAAPAAVANPAPGGTVVNVEPCEAVYEWTYNLG